jgi:hypothetical protein
VSFPQFNKTFNVRRLGPGAYVNGFWQEGVPTVIQIQASVQPVRGDEMQTLPEGRRDSQAVKLYTSTKLQTVDDDNPDILEAFDADFEIISVEPWQSDVINHYKCIGVKL